MKWQAVATWLKKKLGSKKTAIKIIIQYPTGQENTVREITEKIKILEAAELLTRPMFELMKMQFIGFDGSNMAL